MAHLNRNRRRLITKHSSVLPIRVKGRYCSGYMMIIQNVALPMTLCRLVLRLLSNRPRTILTWPFELLGSVGSEMSSSLNLGVAVINLTGLDERRPALT